MAERATQIVREARTAGAGLRGIIAFEPQGRQAALAHAEEQDSADGGRPIAMIDLASNRVIQAGGFGIPLSPEGRLAAHASRENAREPPGRASTGPDRRRPPACCTARSMTVAATFGSVRRPLGLAQSGCPRHLACRDESGGGSVGRRPAAVSEGTLTVLPARIAVTRRTARRPDPLESGSAIASAKAVALRHDRLTIRRRPAEPRVSPGESRQGAEILLAIGSAVTRRT
jgi:hypothetical protein